MGRLEKIATSRRRTAISNKTRLKVVRGDVEDAELLLLEEDENKNKVLDTAGVEHEDAKEEHLVRALAAAARKLGGNTRASKPQDEIALHIPVPDANGLVESDEWTKQYPSGKWNDPGAFVKSSDTVEQSISGLLLDGYEYDMDEKDVEWLDRHNKLAKGEGTSNGASQAQQATADLGRRSQAKARASVTEPQPQPMPLGENEFELAMALLERHTEEKYPYLHLDVNGIPPFSDFEPLFTQEISPAVFASFHVPVYARKPDHVVKLVKTVFPYWKERKVEREGRKIIPQLNYEETSESDPYVCFRRRDVKQVRKTRRADVTPSEKMSRLRSELKAVADLVHTVAERERLKSENARESLLVLDKRLRLMEFRRRIPGLVTLFPHDDQLLMESERVHRDKRPRIAQDVTNAIKIPTKRTKGEESASPYPVAQLPEAINPNILLAKVQADVERFIDVRRQPGWEDYLDLPASLPSGVAADAHFRTIMDVAKAKRDSVSRDRALDAKSTRNPLSIRIRTGRGGRCYVDRRPPTKSNRVRPPSDDNAHVGYLAHFAKGLNVFSLDELKTSETDTLDVDSEKSSVEVQRLDDRWRYDDDAVNADDEKRVVIDDFDIRYITSRLNTFSREDLDKLHPDLSIHNRAEAHAAQKQRGGIEALQLARIENQKKREEYKAQQHLAQLQAQTAVAQRADVTNASMSPSAGAQPHAPSANGGPASSPAQQSSSTHSHPPTPALTQAQAQATQSPHLAQSTPANQQANVFPALNGMQINGSNIPLSSLTPEQQAMLRQMQYKHAMAANNNSMANQANGRPVGQRAVSGDPNGTPRMNPQGHVNGTPRLGLNASANMGTAQQQAMMQERMNALQRQRMVQGGLPNGVTGTTPYAFAPNGLPTLPNGHQMPYVTTAAGNRQALAMQMSNMQAKNGFLNGIPGVVGQQPAGATQRQPGLMGPPHHGGTPQAGQQPNWPQQAYAMPGANGAGIPVHLSGPVNVNLKLPTSRATSWNRNMPMPDANGVMGPPASGVPYQPSPTQARASPARPQSAAMLGRGSPMPGSAASSPISDMHGTPVLRAPTPSPLGLGQDGSTVQQSPRIAIPGAAQ